MKLYLPVIIISTYGNQKSNTCTCRHGLRVLLMVKIYDEICKFAGFFLECGGSSAPKDSAHLPDFV